jgi:Protein of unknown function (DUF3352)
VKKLLIVLVVVVVLAAGLGYAAIRFFGPAQDNAVELVPKDAFVYANVFLNPSNSQKMALEDLLAKFPQAGTPDEAKDFIANLIDEGFASEGIDATFDDDIEPWLGRQIAIFFTPPKTITEGPSFAVLIASEDEEAAMDFARKFDTAETDLEERSYEGVDYLADLDGEGAGGVVGDFLVIANEAGFKAVVDTSKDESLAESERFESATRELRKDRVALLYFDPKPFVELAKESGELPPTMPPSFSSILEEPFVSSFFLRSDAFVLELAQAAPSGSLEALTDAVTSDGNLETLPANAWGAFTFPKVGRVVNGLLNAFTEIGVPGFTRLALNEAFRAQTGLDMQADILSWPGDLAGFVQGTDLQSLGGGVVIESRDPEASARLLNKLQLLARREGAPVRSLDLGDFPGFAIQDPFMPEPVNVIDAKDRVLVTYGRSATLEALGSDPTLGSTADFRAADESLGADFAMSFFLSVDPILRLAESFGAGSDRDYQETKAFLEPLWYATGGSKLSGDSLIQRFVIGVE